MKHDKAALRLKLFCHYVLVVGREQMHFPLGVGVPEVKALDSIECFVLPKEVLASCYFCVTEALEDV